MKIVYSSAIWDLHIHTCMCPKASGEFSKLNVKDYVTLLLKTFSSYKNLQMISFTDHNVISTKVYKEFYSRKSPIIVIPGIEVDVKLPNVDESKHIILYFNIEKNNIEDFGNSLNNFLEDKLPIDIYKLFEYLTGLHINFVVSPHAFKQDKRSIDIDWNSEEKVIENTHKYMDQFYCFWEAAGQTAIVHAVNFLNDFNSGDKISIVSFSDSTSIKKLTSYLDKPTQYFNSLPSYRGLQMAGTDARRIVTEQKNLNSLEMGNMIGTINFNGVPIELSDRLNVIIGGRGSGKSLLLDSLAIKLRPGNKKSLRPDRIDYLETFNTEIKNFAGNDIESDSINFDYYNQAYVAQIFSDKDVSKKIEEYFSVEFLEVTAIDAEQIEKEIKEKYKSLQADNISTTNLENISSLVEKYTKNVVQKLKLPLRKQDKLNKKIIDLGSESEKYKLVIENRKIVPKELQTNEKILGKVYELEKEIFNQIYLYNQKVIQENISDYFIDNYVAYNNEISLKNKQKAEIESLFESHFNCRKADIVRRVNLINALFELNSGFKNLYEEKTVKDGLSEECFVFKRELKIETPVNYFLRLCDEYFDKNALKIKINLDNIPKLINVFCFHIEKFMKDSKKSKDFVDDITNLSSLSFKPANKIMYKNEESIFKDISTFSPGTQTNILMEYIVSKKTSIPLLIDQPEDNIDNETIYTKLTDWFNKLKAKRQIIVVTHDANIVVNADAENVIIANRKKDDEFDYEYGALEFDQSLEKISVILDGGVDAVERRLKKYGGKVC